MSKFDSNDKFVNFDNEFPGRAPRMLMLAEPKKPKSEFISSGKFSTSGIKDCCQFETHKRKGRRNINTSGLKG